MAVFRLSRTPERSESAGSMSRRGVALSADHAPHPDADSRERLDLLSRHAGVGLWDVLLVNGDPDGYPEPLDLVGAVSPLAGLPG